MSHNINFRNGKASMFSVREIPWHGLGTIVDNQLTSKEAIKAAQLDYNVKKGEGYLRYLREDQITLNSKGTKVENTYFTYRDDTGQSLCSNGKGLTNQYQIIQNREAFEFFDSLVKDGTAMYETAGALKDGQLVFVTAKLPEQLLKDTPDKIDQYLLMFLSHDGSSSVIVKFTPVRVVCNNTLDFALSRGRNIKVRHSASYKEKLEEAKKVLGLINEGQSSIEETFDKFANTSIDEREAIHLIQNVFLDKAELKLLAEGKFNVVEHNIKSEIISTRKQNLVNNVFDYYNNGIGQHTLSANGSLWGFINAISGYYQNIADIPKSNGKEKKLISTIEGTIQSKGQKAFAVANKYINEPLSIIN